MGPDVYSISRKSCIWEGSPWGQATVGEFGWIRCVCPFAAGTESHTHVRSFSRTKLVRKCAVLPVSLCLKSLLLILKIKSLLRNLGAHRLNGGQYIFIFTTFWWKVSVSLLWIWTKNNPSGHLLHQNFKGIHLLNSLKLPFCLYCYIKVWVERRVVVFVRVSVLVHVNEN